MPVHPRLSCTAILVAACFLVGCDGEPQKDLAAAVQEIKMALGPRIAPVAAGPGFLVPEEFHRHDMQAFRGGWCQSCAHSSLKLLISAIGPKPLLDHLERFKAEAVQSQEIAAANQFIAIIHHAYNARGALDTEPFFNALQHVAPFNERNIVGDFRYKVENDVYRSEREPGKFLALFSQLFHLDTLPGWSFDIDETYVHQGDEQINYDTRNRFEMFQSVEMKRMDPADREPFDLQKVVDLLHADQERQVKWGEGDAHFTLVKVRRQVRIADVAHFKRLTIHLPDNTAMLSPATFPEVVTLPAVDATTGRALVLRLAPKEVLMSDIPSYSIYIRNDAGQWLIHSEHMVSPVPYRFHARIGKLINFVVIDIALAP